MDKPNAVKTPLMSSPSLSEQVLRALHAARTPGWMFPAHLLDLHFVQPVSAEGAVACLHIGPYCAEASGCVSKAAMAVLADVSMAAAVRGHMGHSVRIATMSLRLSFHQQPRQGLLHAVAQVRFMPKDLAMDVAVVTLNMETNAGELCCVGEGTFAVLDNKQGTANHPLPTESTLTGALTLEALTEAERAVWERALQSEARASASCSSLEYFWGLKQVEPAVIPVQRQVRIGKHNGNRVGHLQGGIVLGVLADACINLCNGLQELVDISVQYLEPVAGSHTCVQVTPLRMGRNASLLQAQLVDADGKLQAMAQCNLVKWYSN